MDSEFIPATLITIFCLFALYFSLFSLTKKRFMGAESFAVMRDITPLPDLVNYWLLKFFIIIAALLFVVIGINEMAMNL